MKGPLNNRNDIIIEVPRLSEQIFTILIRRGGEKKDNVFFARLYKSW